MEKPLVDDSLRTRFYGWWNSLVPPAAPLAPSAIDYLMVLLIGTGGGGNVPTFWLVVGLGSATSGSSGFLQILRLHYRESQRATRAAWSALEA